MAAVLGEQQGWPAGCKGQGEFYAQDILNGKSIFVRWQDVGGEPGFGILVLNRRVAPAATTFN